MTGEWFSTPPTGLRIQQIRLTFKQTSTHNVGPSDGSMRSPLWKPPPFDHARTGCDCIRRERRRAAIQRVDDLTRVPVPAGVGVCLPLLDRRHVRGGFDGAKKARGRE